jgi:YD repeat-containing protein
VSNEAGHLITPVIRASFDSAGNEIVSTDEEGFATHKEYNAYGKPIRASYPDGGEERWTYYLDGTLHSHTDPTGLCTTYTCDYLSRPIRKTISYHNATLAEETYEYQGLHLSAQIDAEGHRTTFTYDRAGRKTAETTALDTTTFQYDEFSRNHRTEQGSLRTVQQYDLLGRIEETREEDVATNHWLRKKGYHYYCCLSLGSRKPNPNLRAL